MSDTPKAEEAVTEEPVAAHIPTIVYDKPRSKDIPLEYPFTFDGEEIKSITIRRATGVEVAEYAGLLASGENVLPPVIKCSIGVYEALDDVDLTKVDEVVLNFLSPRLQTILGFSPETSVSS